jgi:hypothetical protein
MTTQFHKSGTNQDWRKEGGKTASKRPKNRRGQGADRERVTRLSLYKIRAEFALANGPQTAVILEESWRS